MSIILTPEQSQEAFYEAQAIMTIMCPEANFAALPGAGEAFDDGVWFGIAGCMKVLERYGMLKRGKK